jgi:Zn-dependent metalloprotease
VKFLKTGLSLAVIGATFAAFPSTPSVAVGGLGATDKPTLERQMRAEADGNVRTTPDRATGKVGFVKATGADADLLPDASGKTRAQAVAKATAYLDKYAAAFGATKDQLEQVDVSTTSVGTTVSYTQVYQGVPVFGSLLRAHLDEEGDLTSVNGVAVPVSGLSTDARLDEAAGAEAALRQVRANPPVSHDHGPDAGHAGDVPASVEGIEAKKTELFVYREGLVRGVDGDDELVYRVEVSNDANIRDIVFVSAQTGKLVNRYSMVHGALEREVYEEDPSTEPVWTEGDAVPGTLNDQQENLVRASGESYYFFLNSFGRDSYDGEGATMKTVNNDPRINCPNANWNGITTNYCDGVTSDDVVAHEWGHAYTEYTWGGIYQWQSGALNEAYSDIWGESVDLLNGREDEDEGDITTKRTVGQCSTFSPANPVVTIDSPASIARECLTGGASYGPQLDGDGITAEVVTGLDEANAGGPTTTDGCTAYTNAAAVAGKIALVDRGTCPFTDKTLRAQEAGAIAVIIGNNDNATISPSGTGEQFTIPTVTIGLTDREAIRAEQPNGPVTVTMKDASGDREASTRWLVGEKSEAFGGAIRDMWSPTCYGDPGKVSDVEYKCSTDDAGGVHSNSGVPNHGFALLVDGGTYNGVTVPAIGHTKAAHVYFRAMTEYQTPTSDFADHADALEASCADLLAAGEPLTGLSTAGSPEETESPDALADETLTAADCAAIPQMVAAVELRKEPVQCNFQPLLAPGQLSACGEGTVTETTVLDDFEDGISGWTLDQELAEGATGGVPWEATDAAPGGREGTVAWAPDPDLGSCTPDEDDISSRDGLISPLLTIPEGKNARISVDHYVATEAGYDGGNVKASVNGGPFTTIPSSAFVFNPYNTTLISAAAGNTSPLAGQPGFSGTDGGEVTGSWGQSVISLAKLGVTAGDEVKIRFDFGRDGCGGLPADKTASGWYLDNLELTVCKEISDIEAVHNPEPSTYGTASTVDVTAPEAATGEVTLTIGGTEIGSADLAQGSASIPFPATAPARTYPATLSYAGDGVYGASEVPVTITVRKARSTTSVLSFPSQVKRGKKAAVRVRVESPAGTPSGRVTLVRAGKRWGNAVLRNGVATIRTPKLTKPGVYRLVPTYLGGTNYAPSKARTIVIRVKR